MSEDELDFIDPEEDEDELFSANDYIIRHPQLFLNMTDSMEYELIYYNNENDRDSESQSSGPASDESSSRSGESNSAKKFDFRDMPHAQFTIGFKGYHHEFKTIEILSSIYNIEIRGENATPGDNTELHLDAVITLPNEHVYSKDIRKLIDSLMTKSEDSPLIIEEDHTDIFNETMAHLDGQNVLFSSKFIVEITNETTVKTIIETTNGTTIQTSTKYWNHVHNTKKYIKLEDPNNYEKEEDYNAKINRFWKMLKKEEIFSSDTIEQIENPNSEDSVEEYFVPLVSIHADYLQPTGEYKLKPAESLVYFCLNLRFKERPENLWIMSADLSLLDDTKNYLDDELKEEKELINAMGMELESEKQEALEARMEFESEKAELLKKDIEIFVVSVGSGNFKYALKFKEENFGDLSTDEIIENSNIDKDLLKGLENNRDKYEEYEKDELIILLQGQQQQQQEQEQEQEQQYLPEQPYQEEQQMNLPELEQPILQEQFYENQQKLVESHYIEHQEDQKPSQQELGYQTRQNTSPPIFDTSTSNTSTISIKDESTNQKTSNQPEITDQQQNLK